MLAKKAKRVTAKSERPIPQKRPTLYCVATLWLHPEDGRWIPSVVCVELSKAARDKYALMRLDDPQHTAIKLFEVEGE